MEKLILQQNVLQSELDRSVTNFKKDSKTRKTPNYLKKLLERLDTLHSSFQKNHMAIVNSLSGDAADLNIEYFGEDKKTEFEDMFDHFYAQILDLLEDAQKEAQVSKTLENHSELKLPRISLPIFAGEYESWMSFRDLYKSLIHDKTSLSNVEKFHYLKSSLAGEAAGLLRQLQLTDSNYEVAWTILEDRYDHKGALLNAQLKGLFGIGTANESASSIRNLLDKTMEAIQGLTNLGVEDLWQAVIIHVTTQRLPTVTRQLWEQHQTSSRTLPTFDELKNFIQRRFRALEASGIIEVKADQRNAFRSVNSHFGEVQDQCIVCKQQHSIRQCSQFLALDQFDRLNFVKRHGLCFNCLRKGHMITNCSSTSRCLKCKKAHHTLLHKEGVNTTHIATADDNQQPEGPTNVTSLNATAGQEVLLATAQVTVEAPNGRIVLRALLDQGSQASFMSEAAVQLLGLKRQTVNVNVSGIGSSSNIHIRGVIHTQLLVSPNERIKVEALVMEKITNLLPSREVARTTLNQIDGLELADPSFYKPGKIDLLLGADIYAQLIVNGTLKLSAGPILQKTRFGWIVSGGVNNSVNHKTYHSFKVEVVEDMNISKQLRKFWELEELQHKRLITAEEEYCEKYYCETTTRNKDGRYTVRLPFKKNAISTLGQSQFQAVASLNSLERRFANKPELKKEYQQCIEEYIESNHMELIVDESARHVSSKGYYLPHHAVFKESTTTKLRIVFDASRKTSTDVSLNDILLTGPTMQNTMYSVILRWRLFLYAFMADIARMYRQINVHQDDADFQRVVWRSNGIVQHYRLTTVTFGITCAPYLAIRTLHQIAADEQYNHPKAFDMVHNEFYVDDLLSGGRDWDDATAKLKQITAMLKSGGFLLRKLITNEPKLLKGIPDENIEMKNCLEMEMDQGYRSLGILWYPLKDYFSFRIKIQAIKARYTKRQLLSEIAQLFDPMGWLAPVIIYAKMFLQFIWRLGHMWDEPIPDILEPCWVEFRNELNTMENIKIPRYILEPEASTVEMHGFSDASEEAYAAAIYLVSRNDSSVSVHLLTAKTKVAPIKTVSIPRLELCGAVLLARLMREVKDTLRLENVSTWLWTDSEIVLAWLKGQSKRWSVFVANRVTEIYDAVGNTPWRYVPSKENPADMASRGILPSNLVNNVFWWNGPLWLSEDPVQWPKAKETISTKEEERQVVLMHHITSGTSVLDRLVERFSSLDRLVRVTAYCHRFIDKVSKKTTEKGYLTTTELKRAREFWISYVQRKEFSNEINDLKNKKQLSKSSKIRKLFPIIDDKGILRVGGRLENSELAFSEKHPVIIPKTGHFTKLLVR